MEHVDFAPDGSEEMRPTYLPRVAGGALHVALGVTAPDAGTDTTALRTRATPDGEVYIVRGRKVWTTKALYCEKVLLLARTTPLEECERRTDGLTTPSCTPPSSSSRKRHGATTTACPAATMRTRPSSSPPTPVTRPPIAKCIPTAASATSPSTTSSGTGARRA